MSDYHKTGRLRWEYPQDGYGFPVTNTIRDLLIGSDKANEGEVWFSCYRLAPLTRFGPFWTVAGN